jgi:exopolyphosphatase/guanosine-5'-triphosphate,3'-diphosphate pyrophosphatase
LFLKTKLFTSVKRLESRLMTEAKRSTESDPSPGFPLRIGVVDMGSNAIRILAAEFIAPYTWTTLVSDRAPIRLGRSVFETGEIDEESVEAAVTVMERFRDVLDQFDIRHYRAVATSAVRESDNQRQLVALVRKRTGLKLEVISGAEEARLVYWAAKSRMSLGDEPWIMADLGGGSLEIALVDGDGIRTIESLGIGSVRLLAEFEVQGKAGGLKRVRTLLDEYVAGLRFADLEDDIEVKGYIATGGNMDELARLAGADPDESGVSVVPLEDLQEIIEQLAGLTVEERIEKLELGEDRADVILPAAMVYARLAKRFGQSRIHVPHAGVKEGVMIDLVEDLTARAGYTQRHARDVLSGAVALGRRFRFEESHGIHVARLAERLFEELTDVHDLDADDREILVAAAVLHDVGQRIAYARHHKHSYYLISESELPGFDAEEIGMVANIARYHRRADPSPKHEPFNALEASDRDRVTRMAAILRLADALDREHLQKVTEVSAETRDGRVELSLEGDGDLELERWALDRKKRLFEETFDLKVTVTSDEDGQ